MALAAEIDVPYHISGDLRCSPAVHTREMSIPCTRMTYLGRITEPLFLQNLPTISFDEIGTFSGKLARKRTQEQMLAIPQA